MPQTWLDASLRGRAAPLPRRPLHHRVHRSPNDNAGASAQTSPKSSVAQGRKILFIGGSTRWSVVGGGREGYAEQVTAMLPPVYEPVNVAVLDSAPSPGAAK